MLGAQCTNTKFSSSVLIGRKDIYNSAFQNPDKNLKRASYSEWEDNGFD